MTIPKLICMSLNKEVNVEWSDISKMVGYKSSAHILPQKQIVSSHA